MFDKVMNWLSQDSRDKSHEFESDDIRLATAALFFHVVAVDGLVRPVELKKLRSILTERFELDRFQVETLEQQGQDTHINSPGLFPFTVILNRALSPAERRQVLFHLKSLANADGFLHELERDFLDHVKSLLNLDD